MQTANKPENNNNSHEAHPSLGKALKDKERLEQYSRDLADRVNHLQSLVYSLTYERNELTRVFNGWMQDNAKDFQQAQSTEEHYKMKGRIDALRDVIGYLAPHVE